MLIMEGLMSFDRTVDVALPDFFDRENKNSTLFTVWMISLHYLLQILYHFELFQKIVVELWLSKVRETVPYYFQ